MNADSTIHPSMNPSKIKKKKKIQIEKKNRPLVCSDVAELRRRSCFEVRSNRRAHITQGLMS